MSQRTSCGHQLMDAAKAGLGMAILPTFLAAQPIVEGELIEVLGPYTPRGCNISVVYRQSQKISSKQLALGGFLGEKIGDPPIWDQILEAHLHLSG
ncbi:LysR substrate-binding domain-containing protein [Pseudomonas sp. FP1762]|uniref:LysR substrate-binding domain-containing protein n=2 Tax=Pseudomonas TaxID=286 RepID=UPI00351EA3D5